MKGAFVDHFPRGVGDLDGDVPALMRWARASDIGERYTYETGKLFLGQDAAGRMLGLADDRHLMTVAGSRAGKGMSVVIPNLCLYPGSAIVIDPKGENATLTAARRGAGSPYCEGMGQRVYVFDPFGTVPNHESAGFNVLDILDLESEAGRRLAVDDAALLADSIVAKGGKDDVHWDESARSLIEALILHVATTEPPGRRHLGQVRALLMQGDPAAALRREQDGEETDGPFQALLEEMEDNEAFGGVISGVAGRLLDMGERERGSIVSTAARNTKFIDSPPMRDVLAQTTPGFQLEGLKSAPEGMTIYLCLPAGRMANHHRWLRLMIKLALAVMERESTLPALPVLFLMDEFARLGPIEEIATAAGLMAGFGVKLWPILQDLTQLQEHYKATWETFLGNAGCLQFFGNTDVTTLEHVSKRLGKTRMVEVSETESRGRERSLSAAYKPEVTDLLQPAEIRFLFSRGKGHQLVLVPEELPWALRRVPYTDAFFDGKRDWVEGFGEPPPRLDELTSAPAEIGRRRWFR